ncbi:hypothetical protein [Bradyrhizobium sp. 33ap4]|uniref:hypothetical protein n=1 Tax=Bradyrhizobium sp. 33ap4 TaxID=3061630 RepID=UPI00292DDD41|nr:hypothetical protein [Bradyrhizobium sp. 33ap4]
MQALLARLVAQYAVYGVVALVAAGAVTGIGFHIYNKGWNDAIAGVASRNAETIRAVKGAVSKVDDCSANGGFWDTASGLCH